MKLRTRRQRWLWDGIFLRSEISIVTSSGYGFFQTISNEKSRDFWDWDLSSEIPKFQTVPGSRLEVFRYFNEKTTKTIPSDIDKFWVFFWLKSQKILGSILEKVLNFSFFIIFFNFWNFFWISPISQFFGFLGQTF